MILSASVVLSAFVAAAFAADGRIATKHDTSLCVAPRHKPTNGTPVVLVHCKDAHSNWTFDTSGINPLGSFQVTGTNQCLDVKDGAVAGNGARLQTWECAPGNSNQQFVLIDGTTIGWAGQGKCLDVTDGRFAPGTPLQLWDCSGGDHQMFVYPA